MDVDVQGDRPARPVSGRRLELPDGFRSYSGYAGLRDPGEGDDVAVIISERPCACAAVFTQSLFAGPSVILSRKRSASGQARGVVVVAKNANVATGPQGARDAEEVSRLVADRTGVPADDLLIASTGVIGRSYPMQRLRDLLQVLDVESFDNDAFRVARAIMTTDTVPKVAEHHAGPARIVGIAKGVGMIEPDMATMLAFVTTDAEVEAATLDLMWKRAVDETFNRLSVDTDTSTSDMAVVFANGAAGPVPEAELAVALREVCLDLTLQLARDGEGATKLLTITVKRARDRVQAKRVAKAIVNSPLVKSAVHGADPNWGRVVMAIGKCQEQTDIDPEGVVISFGGLETYPHRPGPVELGQLTEIMSADHVEIEVELSTGDAEATVYGCDLSAEYVRINADYTT